MRKGVIQLILGIPNGVAALQAPWTCVFPSKGMRLATVRQEFLGDSTCYYPADDHDAEEGNAQKEHPGPAEDGR